MYTEGQELGTCGVVVLPINIAPALAQSSAGIKPFQPFEVLSGEPWVPNPLLPMPGVLPNVQMHILCRIKNVPIIDFFKIGGGALGFHRVGFR